MRWTSLIRRTIGYWVVNPFSFQSLFFAQGNRGKTKKEGNLELWSNRWSSQRWGQGIKLKLSWSKIEIPTLYQSSQWLVFANLYPVDYTLQAISENIFIKFADSSINQEPCAESTLQVVTATDNNICLPVHTRVYPPLPYSCSKGQIFARQSQ